MACPAYIRDKNCASETSPTVFTWTVQFIYVMKKVTPETFPIVSTWPLQHIYAMKKIWSTEFPYGLHMVLPA
jgi:hypothetical protein